MAERGGQPGNNNATKNKAWRAAIDRAIAQDDGKRLRAAAEALLDAAAGQAGLQNDQLGAMQELGNRLDGKAAQAITGPDGGDIGIDLKGTPLQTPEGVAAISTVLRAAIARADDAPA